MKKSSSISFVSNGVTKMTLDSSGNMGIGTSSPSYSINIEQEEPLTKWYKDAVKARGLTPHKKEIDSATQEVIPMPIEVWKKINGSET